MTHNTIEFDGKKMDYCTFGQGPKILVILPGVSFVKVAGSVEIISEAYKLFHEDYTVYLFDRKDDMEEGYTTEEIAADTVLAMKALGLPQAEFLGCSQGGMIALAIAINHPEMADSIMLVSSASRTNETSRTAIGQWIQWAKSGEISELVGDVGERLYTKEFADLYYPAEFFLNTSEEDLRRMIIMCQAVLDFDIYDRLGEITCPVCVVGAETDDVLSAEASAEIAEKLGCPYYKFSGFKHALYDECPDVYKVYEEFFL